MVLFFQEELSRHQHFEVQTHGVGYGTIHREAPFKLIYLGDERKDLIRDS